LIPELLAGAAAQTGVMLEASPMAARKAKVVAPELPMPGVVTSIGKLAAEARGCERCPLFRDATQTVFGEGPDDAPVVFVGEQPGDQEDLAGRPFVGPAGQMFDRALVDAGLDRGRAYVTNAVKHFKFELRGKRRLHKKPNTGEIDACRWWLDRELSAIKPQLAVALGATAARALTGRAVTISRERGHVIELRPGLHGLITVHPSFLLRLPDAAARDAEYDHFVRDLRVVGKHFPVMRIAA
jgi:DNA polymerase